MDNNTEKALWDELRLLQSIIDKFDDFSFRIKNWFLTVFAAITGYAVVNAKADLVWLDFGIIVIFYFYEVSYRISHRDFLRRSREIQKFLREGGDVNEMKPPYVDKYLYHELNNVPDTIYLRIQRKFRIDDDRARRNVREFRLIRQEFFRLLCQFRVSLPYVAAGIINIAALILVYRRTP